MNFVGPVTTGRINVRLAGRNRPDVKIGPAISHVRYQAGSLALATSWKLGVAVRGLMPDVTAENEKSVHKQPRSETAPFFMMVAAARQPDGFRSEGEMSFGRQADDWRHLLVSVPVSGTRRYSDGSNASIASIERWIPPVPVCADDVPHPKISGRFHG